MIEVNLPNNIDIPNNVIDVVWSYTVSELLNTLPQGILFVFWFDEMGHNYTKNDMIILAWTFPGNRTFSI